MNKFIVSFRKDFVKILFLFLILYPLIFFLNSGLSVQPFWKIIQAFILTLALITIIIRPSLKLNIFSLSLLLLILMVFFYIIDLINWAEIAGSTGLGLIVINLFGYLPQLVKVGYIKRL